MLDPSQSEIDLELDGGTPADSAAATPADPGQEVDAAVQSLLNVEEPPSEM